jgi:transposase
MDRPNRSRIEWFRQFKKEIRGSTEYLIVGIDIAKEKHHAFFGTAQGKTLLKRLLFDNSREGFERLELQVEALQVRHGLSRVVYAMEPTANYHKPLGEYLIGKGYEVVLVGGQAVSKNRTLLDNRWDKHDTKDAANVADLVSQGKCVFYESVDEVLRELRVLLTLKRRLKKQDHAHQIRIRNGLLAQYFPEMDGYYEQGKAGCLGVVKWCLAPSRIAEMGFEEFVRLVTSKRLVRSQENRLRGIWEKAPKSIGCEAREAVAFEAGVIVDQLRQTQEVLKTTEDKIEGLCSRLPGYESLRSIPGFGPDVSSKVLAAIGDPFRFNVGRQVLRLAGLDLNADRSGKDSQKAIPRISKIGKADLRYALFQAALIASSRNASVMGYYTRQLQGREKEKGIHCKRTVKLAAKLLVIAWTLMKKKEVFDPLRLSQK